MSEELKTLSKQCEDLARNIQKGIDWAWQHVDRDRGRADVINRLKEQRRRARRLAATAPLRPATAVFGLSQHGKSYLVSNMVRSGDGNALEVIMPPPNERRADFNDEINPDGGKESTGAVTRFTAQQDPPVSGQTGIQLELLHQGEIASILTTGFMENVTFGESWPAPTVDRERVQDLLQQARKGMDSTERDGLTEDDINELRDYVERRFGRDQYFADLSRLGYWEDMAEIAPRIDARSRAPLFAFLWFEAPAVTKIFERLIDGLAQLGFSRFAAVDEKALIPKTQGGKPVTIIDVNVVSGLSKDQEEPPPLEVRAQHGQATLPRSVVTGLTKEIILQIPPESARQENMGFLQHSDVFDFPGARNPKDIPRAKLERGHEDFEVEIKEVFVRGKVAFLFARYDQEFRVGSLIICQRESNLESTAAAKAAYQWVAKNIGASPDERDGKKNLFFMVFTFWNMELAKQASDREGHESKWQARLVTNFQEEWERVQPVDKWLSRWEPGRSFQSCFFVRDPRFSQAVFDGDGQRETQIRADQKQNMETMRESFVNSPIVRRHVGDPAGMWDGSSTPNKSGAEALLAALSRGTSSEDKPAQVRNEFNRVLSTSRAVLEPHYHGGDKEKEIEKARKEGAQAGETVWRMLKEKGTFGIFLDRLYASPAMSWKVYFDTINEVIDGASSHGAPASGPPTGARPELDGGSIFDFMGSGSGAAEPTEPEGQAASEPVRSKPQMFANTLMDRWYAHLTSLAEDPVLLEQVGLDQDGAFLILRGVKEAAIRNRVQESIASAVQPGLDSNASESVIDRYSAIATQILNDFVSTLGWNQVTDENRPTIKLPDNGQSVPIFSQWRPETPQIDEIVFTEGSSGLVFSLFWIQALYSSFVAAAEDVTFDVDANRQLGEILEGMA